MKNQNFGVEIELINITEEQAAEVIAEYFGTAAVGCKAQDRKGRTWKAVSDGSLSGYINAEVVTPILQYEDIDDLQEIVRRLRKAGAEADSSCGIHVHVGAERHTPKTLRNLVNIMASKQDMIYRALAIEPGRAERYCKKLEGTLIDEINRQKPQTSDKLADVWYHGYNGSRDAYYNSSRYHGLNLHAVFTKGTIEFRLFNGTTHAGKIKAYIQFCLAISNQALTQKYASPKATVSDNEAYTFRTWLLRLGFIGDEFKAARMHLLENFDGDKAWRHGDSTAA